MRNITQPASLKITIFRSVFNTPYQTFFPVTFRITTPEKLCSDVVKHIEKCPFYGLNLLNFVYVVVFDVKTALGNVKLAILEELEFQTFFTSNFDVRQVRAFSSEKISGIL